MRFVHDHGPHTGIFETFSFVNAIVPILPRGGYNDVLTLAYIPEIYPVVTKQATYKKRLGGRKQTKHIFMVLL